jgi:hypothetical protein
MPIYIPENQSDWIGAFCVCGDLRSYNFHVMNQSQNEIRKYFTCKSMSKHGSVLHLCLKLHSVKTVQVPFNL